MNEDINNYIFMCSEYFFILTMHTDSVNTTKICDKT